MRSNPFLRGKSWVGLSISEGEPRATVFAELLKCIHKPSTNQELSCLSPSLPKVTGSHECILVAAACFTALLNKVRDHPTSLLSLESSSKSTVVSAGLGRWGKEAVGVPWVHLESSFLKILRCWFFKVKYCILCPPRIFIDACSLGSSWRFSEWRDIGQFSSQLSLSFRCKSSEGSILVGGLQNLRQNGGCKPCLHRRAEGLGPASSSAWTMQGWCTKWVCWSLPASSKFLWLNRCGVAAPWSRKCRSVSAVRNLSFGAASNGLWDLCFLSAPIQEFSAGERGREVNALSF